MATLIAEIKAEVPLPEDIIAEVRQGFSEDDSLHVLKMLSELQGENPDLFGDRILRCIVVLGSGSIEKVSKAAQLARDDYRELISAAEYDWGNRIRLLSLPFGIYPNMEVFKQWLAGQQIVVPWGIGCDEKWTIECSQIRELSLEQVHKLKAVTETVSDPNLYVAYLSFLCIRGPREISASKGIEAKAFACYLLRPETGGFEFQRFWHLPKDVQKRGQW